MKRMLTLALLAGSLFLASGCATPAYSGRERSQQIARNWDYEGKQIIDDFDHIMLLRPAGRLTIWHVR
jgi:hypothetical protein